jgi:hypothetical protein
MKKILVLAALAVSLTACSGSSAPANQADVHNVKATPLPRLEVYSNIDEHANVARFCLDGLAFYTVSSSHTAPYQATPLVRVPEWDKTFCQR